MKDSLFLVMGAISWLVLFYALWHINGLVAFFIGAWMSRQYFNF